MIKNEQEENGSEQSSETSDERKVKTKLLRERKCGREPRSQRYRKYGR